MISVKGAALSFINLKERWLGMGVFLIKAKLA